MSDFENDEVIVPKVNLFKSSLRTKPLRLYDVTDIQPQQWAITVNISPHKYMNKKKWSTYDHNRQRLQLGRIEASLRKNNPSIVLDRLVYETCPTLNQIHFHALYTMPEHFRSTVEAWFERICSTTNERTTRPWRHLDIQPIFNEEGWLRYISKDITNVVNPN